METMRDSWTDERMDDLREDMNRGFGRVDADTREVRSEIGVLRAEMHERFASVDARFDALQRTMVIGFATIGGGVLASVVAAILS